MPKFLPFHLSDDESKIRDAMAMESVIGGKSNVTACRGNESQTFEWQQAGHAGEMVWSKFQFSSIMPYLASRSYHNDNLMSGDGGYDPPGFKIDVKMTLVPGAKWDDDYISRLHLIVDPDELHAGWVYVQGFVRRENTRTGCLAAWAYTGDLELIISDERRDKSVLESVMSMGVQSWRVEPRLLQMMRAEGPKCVKRISKMRDLSLLTKSEIAKQWDAEHYRLIQGELPENEARCMSRVYLDSNLMGAS